MTARIIQPEFEIIPSLDYLAWDGSLGEGKELYLANPDSYPNYSHPTYDLICLKLSGKVIFNENQEIMRRSIGRIIQDVAFAVFGEGKKVAIIQSGAIPTGRYYRGVLGYSRTGNYFLEKQKDFLSGQRLIERMITEALEEYGLTPIFELVSNYHFIDEDEYRKTVNRWANYLNEGNILVLNEDEIASLNDIKKLMILNEKWYGYDPEYGFDRNPEDNSVPFIDRRRRLAGELWEKLQDIGPEEISYWESEILNKPEEVLVNAEQIVREMSILPSNDELQLRLCEETLQLGIQTIGVNMTQEEGIWPRGKFSKGKKGKRFSKLGPIRVIEDTTNIKSQIHDTSYEDVISRGGARSKFDLCIKATKNRIPMGVIGSNHHLISEEDMGTLEAYVLGRVVGTRFVGL
jgi:hypothetical protein